MVLLAQTEKQINLLTLGLEVIEIRKKKYITLHKLAKYKGISRDKMEFAHLLAINHLGYDFPKVLTDGKGNKRVKYEVMKVYIADKEPDFMKNAQTQLQEPEWMKQMSNERLFGMYASC